MGQKINPIGFRLGINRTWDSRWYANKGEYGSLLQEDLKIRETLLDDLKQAAVSKIVIERPHRKCRVSIHTARPGIVIGTRHLRCGRSMTILETAAAFRSSISMVRIFRSS